MSIKEEQAHVDPKHVAEELLGTIKWATDFTGYCQCPGINKHTGKTGDRECIIYLEGAPTIFCLHQSCISEVQEANKELRRSINAGTLPATASKRELKEHTKAEMRRVRLEQRSRTALPQILKSQQWTLETIRGDSPDAPETSAENQWKDIVRLFEDDDVVWIGDKWDSGSTEKQGHFQCVKTWLNGSGVAGQLTCPATFKVGSFSRSNENVLQRRFLVVESDVLSKDEIGAVFKWLRDKVGLRLRAIVDTAGKSLHGWFDYPKKSVVEELEIILPQLACDKGLFRASQPCRIPGALRDGRYQTLLYLDKAKKTATVKKPSDVLPLPDLYFADFSQVFWRQTALGNWQRINEKALDVELKAQGYSSEEEPGELLCEKDRIKRDIQLHNNLAYAARLAGYQPGPLKMFGRNILVTEGPTIIVPQPGPHPLITHLVEGLLKTDEVDQSPYFYGWIHRAYEALKSGYVAPAQALAIAGPKNSGKSLLQNLITEMIGGRVAKPYHFMTGKTGFNSGMFAAEHLMIEDEAASTRMENRKALGAMIKAITVNETQACYTKHGEEITLTPFWRLSITMNEEPEDLMVLPPFYDGVEEKILLLKASPVTMPMPTETLPERKAYWNALVSEVPAFLATMEAYQIPHQLKHSRFATKTYHHPDLLEKVGQLQPEYRLMSLIDDCQHLFGFGTKEWQGTALKLESLLSDKDWSLGHQARNLLTYQNTCGTLLGRLASQNPERVAKVKTTDGNTVWQIMKSGNN